LELHALTLVARSYALLERAVVRTAADVLGQLQVLIEKFCEGDDW